jgi:tRNA-Thr(GGU) m(6)t(6)A37 methyltransferase TsaA
MGKPSSSSSSSSLFATAAAAIAITSLSAYSYHLHLVNRRLSSAVSALKTRATNQDLDRSELEDATEKALTSLASDIAILSSSNDLAAVAAETAAATTSNIPSVAEVYQPIGTVKSCFRTITTTPRNAFLVPEARASITLHSSISPATLEGLASNSHLWVVFVFHKNNNQDAVKRVWSDPGYTFRAKVRVPRNNAVQGDGKSGVKVGCFATRTPHRPNPIGLTLARIESIDEKTRTIHLRGSDLLDGTPVLDVKPYVPCYDDPTILEGQSAAVRAAEFSNYKTFTTRKVMLADTVSELFADPKGLLATKWLRLYKKEPAVALAAIKGTLANDLSRGVTLTNPLKPYVLEFDGVVLEYIVEGDDCDTKVISVRAASRQEGGSRGKD